MTREMPELLILLASNLWKQSNDGQNFDDPPHGATRSEFRPESSHLGSSSHSDGWIYLDD